MKYPVRSATARAVCVTLLIAYALGVTVSRSLSGPNDFAEEHWLLSYRWGFVKRGLVGHIFQSLSDLLSIPVSDRSIAIVSTVLFGLFCATLLLLCVRIVSVCRWSAASVLVVLVFLTSPFMVMNASIVGYYDNIVMMAGIGAIALLLSGHPWLGALLQIPAFLAHENTLLLVYPGFCLAWLLRRWRGAKEGARTEWLPAVLPLAGFIVVLINQERMISEDFMAGYRAHLSHFSFVAEHLNPVLPQIMAAPFSTDLRADAHRFGGRIAPAEMHGLVLPSLLCFLLFIGAGRRAFSAQSLLPLGVAAAPLAMHAIATDTARIWTYSIFCMFIALWVCVETKSPHLSRSTLLPSLLVLAANFVVVTPLMGGDVEKHSLPTRLCLLAPLMVAAVIYIYVERRNCGVRHSRESVKID